MSSIAFFDSRLPDIDRLTSALPAETVTVLLQPDADGLAQIAATLANQGAFDELLIFSHGSIGTLSLGNTSLSRANLDAYRLVLAEIGRALTADGKVLLFGCNIAAGETGKIFVDALAARLGVGVAASDDLTGATRLGGDWDLEYSSGIADGQTQQLHLENSRYNALLANNSAPVFSGLNGIASYRENSAAVPLDGTVSIADAELGAQGHYNGASITLSRHGGANSDDVFSALGDLSFIQGEAILPIFSNNVASSITVGLVENADGMLTIRFNSLATQARVNQVLSSIGYSNTSNMPLASIPIDWIFDDGNRGGAQGDGGALTASGSTTVSITAVNDPPVGAVTVTGITSIDQTLTANQNLADADGLGTIGYQWQASTTGTSWQNIGGATTAILVLTQAEVGKKIRMYAYYTDAGGKLETVISNPTVAVGANYLPTGSLKIIGNTQQGQVLSVSSTLADANGIGTLSYQWQADGKNVATGDTYTPTQSDVGKKITVIGSYTDDGGKQESATSAATPPITNTNDAPTGNVKINGTAKQGQTLTASHTLADLDGLGAVSYQWRADNKPIGIGNTYVLTQAEVGKTVTVTASYTDGFGEWESQISDATLAVENSNDLPVGAVTISGHVKQGETLRVSDNLSDADGLGAIRYQWQVSGDNGKTWFNLNNATTDRFTPTQTEVGKLLRVVASYDDAFGVPESKASVATDAVSDAPDLAQPISDQLAISALPFNFTFDAQTFSDVDVGEQLSYAATRPNGGALPTWLQFDANTRSFSGTPTEADEDLSVAVKITATDRDGASASDEFAIQVSNNWIYFSKLNGVASYRENGTAVALDNSVEVVDAKLQAKGHYSGAVLALQRAGGANAEDLFGTTGELSVIAGKAFLSGVQIGTVTNGDGRFTMTFNADATQARVNTALSSLIYANTSEAPPASIQIDWTFRDEINGIPNSADVSKASGTTEVNLVAVNDAPVGSISMSGINLVGQTLIVKHQIDDADGLGLINYQWQHSGNGQIWQDIDGAITNSYVLAQSDVGKQVRLYVYYIDDNGKLESVITSATAAVSNIPVALNATTLASISMSQQIAFAEQSFSFALEQEQIFTDTSGRTLDFTATQTDGKPLPAWLSFDPKTLTFSGRPDQADANQAFAVRITMAEQQTAITHDEFLLSVFANKINGTSLSDKKLLGTERDDFIDGRSGVDTMTGGNGNDRYLADKLQDKIVEKDGGGIDSIYATDNFKLPNFVENLYLGDGVIGGIGNASNNLIVGNDTPNLLDGGLGSDVLFGGLGKDAFTFSTKPGTGNVDTVLDFTPGEDRIGLSLKMFAKVAAAPGVIAATAFASGANLTQAPNAAVRLFQDTVTHTLYYDADGSGGKSAPVPVAIVGVDLQSTDFLVG